MNGSASREMVTQGVTQYRELTSRPQQGNLLCPKRCKECIDRGMMKYAEDLLFLGDRENAPYATTATQSRTLLVRSRAILPDRFEQAVAYQDIITYETAHTFLTKTIAEIANSPEPESFHIHL